MPHHKQVPVPDRWGEVFGDEVVAAAMIYRLVHHAEVISMKGDSYRLKDRDLGRVPTAKDQRVEINNPSRGSTLSRRLGGKIGALAQTP
jgi:IstB-like ATP binding protein